MTMNRSVAEQQNSSPAVGLSSTENVVVAEVDPLEPQAVPYRDLRLLAQCQAELAARTPIVSVSAINRLLSALERAERGEAFVIQAGDCAESFASAEIGSVRRRLRVLWQLSVLLQDMVGVPVIRIGRIAGQYAKPRSEPHEIVDGKRLLAFRGENVNGIEPTPNAREPQPERLLQGHDAAADTVELLNQALRRSRSELRDLPEPLAALAERHGAFAEIKNRLAAAAEPPRDACVGRELFISHEALLLPYEKALTRHSESSSRAFNLGAHFLWLGERTRDLKGAHTSYLRSIANPIGVKLGPKATAEEIRDLILFLNPAGHAGRLTLIPRLGKDHVRRVLPEWIAAVNDMGASVLWSCDPMHANTFKTARGIKSRRVADVVAEIEATFAVHREMGSHLSGVHLEVAGEEVTECVGGLVDVTEADLGRRYESLCDPRLSHAQSLEVIAQMKPYRTDNRKPQVA
jgi:3-deoxy-7-phosphoheptulonate synthase